MGTPSDTRRPPATVLNIVAIYAVDHHHRIVTAGLLPVLVRAASALPPAPEAKNDGLEPLAPAPAPAAPSPAPPVQNVPKTGAALEADLEPEPESVPEVETLEHDIERLFDEAVGLGAINAKAVAGMRAGMANNKMDAAFCREVVPRAPSPFCTLTARLADAAVEVGAQTAKGGSGPRR